MAKAVFICRGISTSNGPKYIIAASADHWTGYKKLSNFVKKLRDHRRKATTMELGRGRGEEASFITEWSDDLWRRRNKGESLSRLVTHPEGCFSHLHDFATPLDCPSFQPKPRCIRCQALFEYVVPDHVSSRERGETALYKGFTCAETYAHFLCEELEGKGHATCFIRRN